MLIVSLQSRLQHMLDEIGDFRLLRGTRASNVQPFDVMCLDECEKFFSRFGNDLGIVG